MGLIQDGDNIILTSNSSGDKGKIYLNEAKTSYFDESADSLHLEADIDQTGDQVISGDITADTFNGAVVGDITGDSEGTHTGGVVGDVTGDLTGDVLGNVEGNVTGDLTGDVEGNVTGDVTGAVIGDVTGDLTGDLYGAYKGTKSAFIDDPSGTSDAEDVEARATIANVIDVLIARGLMDATA